MCSLGRRSQGASDLASELVFESEDWQRAPLIRNILHVTDFVPVVRCDVLAVVCVPNAQVHNEIGSAEVETPVDSDVERVVVGMSGTIDPV